MSGHGGPQTKAQAIRTSTSEPEPEIISNWTAVGGASGSGAAQPTVSPVPGDLEQRLIWLMARDRLVIARQARLVTKGKGKADKSWRNNYDTPTTSPPPLEPVTPQQYDYIESNARLSIVDLPFGEEAWRGEGCPLLLIMLRIGRSRHQCPECTNALATTCKNIHRWLYAKFDLKEEEAKDVLDVAWDHKVDPEGD